MARLVDFRDDEPAAPNRQQNVKWQKGTSDIGGRIISTANSGTSVTFVTELPHNLHNGDLVFVQAGSDQGSSGTWAVEVLGPSSFTIPAISSGISYPGDGLAVYGAVKFSAYLTDFIGDAGSSSLLSPPESPPNGGLGGGVPAPPAGSAAAGMFLYAGGTWEVPGSVGSPPIPNTRRIDTLYPLEGGGDLSIDREHSIAVFVGAYGSPPSSPPTGGLPGAVPAPGPGDVGKVLGADGGWIDVPPGAGSVPETRRVDTEAPLTGGGDLSADLDLGITDFVGDSGSPPTGGARGTVPAPAPGDAAAQRVLGAGGGWVDTTPPTRRVDTELPLTGGGALSVDLDLGINDFTPDAVSPPAAGLRGTVPAPASGDTAAGKFLATTGWEVLPGIGAQPYDVICAFVGKPGAGAIVFLYTPPRTISFPVNFSGASGSASGTVGTNPSSTATYTIKKNGSTVGTVVVSTGGAFTFATSGGAFSIGTTDRLVVFAPSSQDATLSDVTFTLPGTR